MCDSLLPFHYRPVVKNLTLTFCPKFFSWLLHKDSLKMWVLNQRSSLKNWPTDRQGARSSECHECYVLRKGYSEKRNAKTTQRAPCTWKRYIDWIFPVTESSFRHMVEIHIWLPNFPKIGVMIYHIQYTCGSVSA